MKLNQVDYQYMMITLNNNIMTQTEIDLIKRVQYLEFKLEIVYIELKKLQSNETEVNLDEFKEA